MARYIVPGTVPVRGQRSKGGVYRKNGFRVSFWVIAFVGFFLGQPCLAGNPVALIYDIQGGSDRPLEAFSEFVAGDDVTLDNDAELTFLHYPTCKTVVLKGGHLSFTDERYMFRKGEVVSEQIEKCPKTVVLDEGDEIGGVVMRSASATLKLATVPEFVLVGLKRESCSRVRVSLGDEPIAELPLSGYAFTWPAAQAPLSPGKGYQLEFVSYGGLRTIAFDVVDKKGPRPVTLVRVD